VDVIKIPFIPIEAKNGQLYNLTLRFHFFDSLYTGEKVFHHVDYPFANLTLKDVKKIGSNMVMQNEVKSVDLYISLGFNFSKMNLREDIVGRRMHRIEYITFTSGKDYIDYIQYTLPSLSVSQTKPLYSNFANQAALGIFTFRTRCSVNKELDVNFKKSFASNIYTSAYRFY
jgi:hypothetical protein